jgi:hypothetical protein
MEREIVRDKFYTFVENLDDGFISIYVNETFARGF